LFREFRTSCRRGPLNPSPRQPIDSRDELKRFRNSSQSRRHPPPILGGVVAFPTPINHLAVTR
jgi:hypothetical protein